MASPELHKTGYGFFQISNKTFDETKLLLLDKPIGTFVVRPSSNAGQITLSIIYANNKIGNMRFHSVRQLIDLINSNNGFIPMTMNSVNYNVKLISSFIYEKFQDFSPPDPLDPQPYDLVSASVPILALPSITASLEESLDPQGGGYKQYLIYKQKCINMKKNFKK
jgi:hypothetical protein